MKIIAFERLLTLSEFETKLRGSSPTTKEFKGWTDEVKKQGLFLDLSRVEFAEFSTLSQVALLVEGAARHGINIKIALPLPYERIGEEEFINQNLIREKWVGDLRSRVNRRKKALRFMYHSGFVDAIKVKHVPHSSELIEIDYKFDKRRDVSDSQDEGEENPSFNYLLKNIFPMRWFEPQTGSDLLKSENFAKAVLGLKVIGLEEQDVEVLVGTLLNELVENVFHYASDVESRSVSCRPFALVGAITLDHGYQFRAENYLEIHQEFIQQVNTEKKNKVVRIIVGDSGIGIPQTLGQYFTPEKEREIPKFDKNKIASENDKILLWSLNRWSTSNLDQAGIKRGTRGLWKINRLVRSYHGFITIRSDDSLISIIHGLESSKADRGEIRPRYINGTFVDICLLPTLDTRKTIKLPITKNQNPPDFEVIYCDANSIMKSQKELFQKLVNTLAMSVEGNVKCLVLAIDNIPLESKHSESFFLNFLTFSKDLESFFNFSQELANPGAVALVLLNANWQQIETGFESANLDYDSVKQQGQIDMKQQEKLLDDPVFVIDQTGESRWLGGNRAMREILPMITNNENGELDYEILESYLENLPTNNLIAFLPKEYSQNLNKIKAIDREMHIDSLKMHVYKSLRDQPDIIEFNTGKIQLRFTSKHILQAVVNYVEAILKDAIEKADCESVQKDAYRIPTLEQVDTWIDVSGLLEEKSLFKLAAFALSSKLKLHFEEITVENHILARIDTTSFILADLLRKCINHEEDMISFGGGLGIFENEELSDIGTGKKVIILTDIIMTANTLKHILAKLIRWRTNPVIVICVFDARDLSVSRKIECLGQKFEILSLANINIKLNPNNRRKLINIDPVLRQPLKREHISRDIYKISSIQFLEWCSRHENSIFLGHIEGITGKHFLSFLNGDQTIDKIDLEELELADHFYTVIKKLLDEIIEQSHKGDLLVDTSIEIWHPPDKFSARLGSLLSGKLGVSIVKKIPRAPMSGKWVFPINVETLEKNTTVIIIDWGALTSGTVHQLTRLAVESNAKAVLAVVFLSQMSPDEELAVTRIRSFYRNEEHRVSGSSEEITSTQLNFFEDSNADSSPIEIKKIEVPVRIEFLSHLNWRFYMPSECPLCQLRENFQYEEKNCRIKMLREYAEKRQKLLKAKSKETVFDEGSNIYGENLDSSEIVEILKIWQDLNLALRFTEQRYQVFCKLQELNNQQGELNQKIVWIRALSSDPNWLKVHPLRFDKLRNIIANIAINVIEHKFALEEVIQQALIVLRVSSIFKFIALLPIFFKKFISSQAIIEQLLYDVYSYLNKEIYESPEMLDEIYKSLLECQEFLLSIDNNSNNRKLENLLVLGSLLRISEFRKYEQEYTNISETAALANIRGKYTLQMGSHHEVVSSAFYINNRLNKFKDYNSDPILNNEGILPTVDDIRLCIQEWQKCESFLNANVFPFLNKLESLFKGNYYSSILSPENNFKLSRLFDRKNLSDFMEPVSTHLQQLVEKADTSLNIEIGTLCFKEFKWWYDFFLKADQDKENSPLFVKLLAGVPCDLVKEFNDVISFSLDSVEEFSTNNPFEPESSIEVYCDRDLLKNCLNQIIQNALRGKHSEEIIVKLEWRIKPDEIDDHFIWLFARNTASNELTPSRGRGLVTLNEKLEPFRGTIAGDPIINNTELWTYEVSLRLLKWRHKYGNDEVTILR